MSEVSVPWHKGDTSSDQVMFLDASGHYCGDVQIEQTGGGSIAAVDEPRRRACADLILTAVNASSPARIAKAAADIAEAVMGSEPLDTSLDAASLEQVRGDIEIEAARVIRAMLTPVKP